MTKRKPKQYRDERGRFAHASPEVRAGLEAMRPDPRFLSGVGVAKSPLGEIRPIFDYSRIDYAPPPRRSWLRHFIEWVFP